MLLLLHVQLFLLQLLSQIPCASMLMKCPFKVIIEEKEWFHYYKPGDYWITGIMSGVLARLYQFSFSKPPTHQLKRVWIATTLKALSVIIFDLWIDLQNKHALFSFFMQTKRRTRYYNFKSYASMVILYGKEAFQCSYSSPLLSKKVWKKCREKENWEFPPHDVIARILSQDSSSISQIIQIVAWVLNAASYSQRSKRRMQVGYHQPSQIVQPWQ
ncbi:hypothetical protein E2320_014578, partial [Naja naja]